MIGFLLLFAFQLHAFDMQSQRIDSLKTEIEKLGKSPLQTNDSMRFSAIKELMKTYADRNIDSSFHYNKLLTEWCKKPLFQGELAYIYQYAGYLFQVKGDYHQSIRYYFKALATAEKMAQFKQMAGARRGLAHAYVSLEEYTKAVSHCEQGLAALRKEPDAYTRLGILNVQGSIYRAQKKLGDALKTNFAMFALAKQAGEPWYQSQGLHAIGWVYKEMGNSPKAMEYYRTALAIAKNIGSADLECSILLNISEIYSRQQRWPLALQYCKLARRRADETKNSSIISESEEKMYRIFKATGRPENALASYEHFITLRDSLSKEKTDHRIENLHAQYDNVRKTNTLQKQQVQLLSEQNRGNALSIGILSACLVAGLLFWNNRRLQGKNRQISAQHQQIENAREELAYMNKTLELRVAERTDELLSANKELQKKNEEIREALFTGQKIERKRVALELHDNLSSLLSAVNMSMQSINPRSLSELEQNIYKNVVQMIRNAYSEVRNISHNILPPELEQEGLIPTLHSLIDKIGLTGTIKVSLGIEDMTERLPREVEFNLYSIIFELVNNTIRHAQATHLTIALRRTLYGVDLTVLDDGIGLSLQPEKRGRGLQNIHTRLESLGGSFETQVPTGKGTWIIIKIPIEAVRINGNQLT